MNPDLLLAEARRLYGERGAPEAVVILEQLLQEKPRDPNYLVQLALYLRAVGRFEESLAALKSVPPSMPGCTMLMGWHLLRQGKFLEGMKLWEGQNIYRAERLQPFPKQKKLQPSTPLEGARILLVLEGGAGDEVAYARFAQMLHAKGAIVIAAASGPMMPIIERAVGVSGVFPFEAISHDQYDYYLPAMSSIALFGITDPSENITFPYISPEREHSARWRALVEQEALGMLKIGVQWQGNTEFDHIEFKTFPASLIAQFSNLGRLFSLQRKENLGENTLPQGTDIVDTQSAPPDWEDTLSIINEMDYVIAGDTTVAHMAGALGKKTLLLLPHAPHPYWAALTLQAQWYPSVRVFRQPAYNDWEGAARAAYTYIEENV